MSDCVDPRWAIPAQTARSLVERNPALRNLAVPGCTFDAEQRIVDCLPGGMRAATERQLRSLGFPIPLSLDAYIMARNIKSEAGSGSLSEKVAIGEALANRARLTGKTLSQTALRDGKNFAAQSGSNPAMSTRQDPGLEEIVIANLVLSGQTGGLARGAQHYFSPRGMASQAAALDLYESRIADGLAWIGPVSGINPRDQFFMVKVQKGSATWLAQAFAGRQALSSTSAPPELVACTNRGGAGFAIAGGLALLAATFYVVPKLRRHG